MKSPSSLLQLCLGIALAAVLGVLALVWSGSAEALRTPYFLTGWLTFVFAVAAAATWWLVRVDAVRLAQRARLHLALAGMLAVATLIHVDLRVPNGGFEIALCVLLVATLASAFMGLGIASADERRARRWLTLQVALVHGLLALAFVHGSLVHLHGFVAPFVKGA